jgi:hypothetical protein
MFKCNNIFKYNNNEYEAPPMELSVVVKHLVQVEIRVNKMKTYW